MPIERTRRSQIERHAVGFDQLLSAARGWTPERAARVTGIDAPRIRELAAALQRAQGA